MDKQSKHKEPESIIGIDAQDLKASVEELLSKSSDIHHYRFKPLCEVFWNNYTTPQLATLCACFYKDKRDRDDGLDASKNKIDEMRHEIVVLTKEKRAHIQNRSNMQNKIHQLQVELLANKGLHHTPYENEKLYSFVKRMGFSDKWYAVIFAGLEHKMRDKTKLEDYDDLLGSDLTRLFQEDFTQLPLKELPKGVKRELLTLIHEMKQENEQESGLWDPGRIDSKYTNKYFL